MMTDNDQYNEKVANELLAIAVKLDTASAKLDATAATLADSIATMNSQQLVSPPQLHLLSPSLRPLASTPTSNSGPISEESSIATLPRNATHEKQKAHAEYMSRNYESDVKDLRAALDLADRNSFSKGDPTCRNPNHSRSRFGGKKITNKTKKRTYKKSKKSYKKSKRSSYKKSKRTYKSKRSVKRGGVVTSVSTYPVAFTIRIPHTPNIEEPR